MSKEPQSIGQLFSQQKSILQKAGDDPVTLAQVKEEFKHIELTESEIASAYLYAYKNKVLKLQKEKEERIKKERIEAIKAPWSYEECYQYALSVGHAIGQQRNFDFILDDANKGVFNLLALYFSNNKKFEETTWFDEKFSLKKGICLLSPVRGNGKTTLLDCFMYNKIGCYSKISTKFIADQYNMFGLAQIKKYMWLMPTAPVPLTFYQESLGFHYDDFGDEQPVVHMGTHKRISSDIINSIYDNHRDNPQFNRFHISMNYKWSEYESNFGSNTANRLSEMFNLIKVPGESRRVPKKK